MSRGTRGWVGGAVRLLAVLVGAGCEPEPAPAPVMHRFVDVALDDSPGEPDTATIRHDTRYVLPGHPGRVLADRRRVEIDEEGRLVLRLAVDDVLGEADQLVLSGAIGVDGRWIALEPGLAPVRGEPGSRTVEWEPDLPALDPGVRPVIVEAHRASPRGRTRHRTRKVAIPEDAVLEFAMGVLVPAVHQGPVRFDVFACAERCVEIFSETVDAATDEAAWRDRSVSLSRFAGQRRAFEFRTEHLGVDPEAPASRPDAFTLPVWANPTLHGPPAAPGADPPSLLLISIDTLRADHTSIHGYHRDTTPFLAGWAAEHATVFEQMVAAATHTGPSHMTLFTSLPPATHGATVGLAGLSVPVATLAGVLRRAGYQTAAFTEDGPLARSRGFGRGFDVYVENTHPAYYSVGQLPKVLSQARHWLERTAGRRSFLFLHTFQVHDPFRPPARYGELFGSDPAAPAQRGPDVARLRRMIADYDREIRYVDDLLREFFGWLEARGLADRTVMVVTSDHGEAFFEHGFSGHTALPYQELVHVPLVVAGPGIDRGRRVAARVTHADLMPTLLELAGVEAPPSVRGHSLVGLLDGAGEAPSDRPLFSESWGERLGVMPPATSVRVGRFKALRWREADGERTELYDLESDPDERRDLSETRPDTLRALLGRLDAHRRRAEALRRELTESPTGLPGRDALLDPGREAMMRALGYIE